MIWLGKDIKSVLVATSVLDCKIMKELHHKAVLNLLLHSKTFYATKVFFSNQTYFQLETNSITL